MLHPTQHRILETLSRESPRGLSYDELGRLVDINVRQKLWYHVKQLRDQGLLRVDPHTKLVYRTRQSNADQILALPMYGAANCGVATMFAEDRIAGFLHISKSLLDNAVQSRVNRLVVVEAAGDSMNKAQIGNRRLPISDGDYVLVDTSDRSLDKKDKYIASVIDGMANIKKAHVAEDRIELISESTNDYPPMFIHENDQYVVAGTVVQVIPREASRE